MVQVCPGPTMDEDLVLDLDCLADFLGRLLWLKDRADVSEDVTIVVNFAHGHEFKQVVFVVNWNLMCARVLDCLHGFLFVEARVITTKRTRWSFLRERESIWKKPNGCDVCVRLDRTSWCRPWVGRFNSWNFTCKHLDIVGVGSLMDTPRNHLGGPLNLGFFETKLVRYNGQAFGFVD